ncbi:MAG: hypothetical protein Q9207_000687 [Kuettlingeria erythrocarpa]
MDPDVVSDYGSDFTADEEEILSGLLLQQAPTSPATGVDLVLKDIEDDGSLRGARIARRCYRHESLAESRGNPAAEQATHSAVEVAGDAFTAAKVESSESVADRTRHERSVSIDTPMEIPPGPALPEGPDLRSPLERFRTKPRKPLSVSDLVSPSWCELQYWFILTKHGRKRRTPAMKLGTAVHKTLEDEVHRTVAVQIKTKEDAWGLRIWNVIQGLRSLRETGMTRELEVWAILDGQVVNGVIDELSYICPDRGLEATESDASNDPPPLLPADQRSITDFLSPNGSQNLSQANFGASATTGQNAAETGPRIYVSDVKTRNSSSVPKAASFRPTLIQLMLYHRLLSAMATNTVDPSILFSRYELKADEPFTDAFIAQISEMSFDAPSDLCQTSQLDPSSSSAPVIDQDTLSLLLAHNSLTQLWYLMVRELRSTFPHGEKSIGGVLKAEYRNASSGRIMGSKTFLYDQEVLDAYMNEGMKWWKGERPAVGVCVEEAYKCATCDFADECDWRKGKIEEAREKVRMEKNRRKSVV